MSLFETFTNETGELSNALLSDAKFTIWRSSQSSPLTLNRGTHYGAVYDGELTFDCHSGRFTLRPGMVFCIPGSLRIEGDGHAFGITAQECNGFFQISGPVEETGRLRYIDGCTDSLIISPMRKGEPCLNHLHFPSQIDQSKHTHPSFRAGLILAGQGTCRLQGRDVDLRPGLIFHLPADVIHGFKTTTNSMDVIAFHPDSDFGPIDDDHPMINRTIVDGVSAREISSIQT